MTKDEIEELKSTNYVRVAQPINDYWVDFSREKLQSEYIKVFGTNFNIIIYSQLDFEKDFYVIPFKIIEDLFKEEFLAKDTQRTEGSRRWVVNIKNHLFKVSNCTKAVDVKDFFSNKHWIKEEDIQSNEDNDYFIEDKRQEINVRLKQSKFRQSVLDNFNRSCCISDITEEDLLVASHIIPWGHKKETRLNPINGLCLFVLYDKLFDKGYFTISDDFIVQVINEKDMLSAGLKDTLNIINGRKITLPKRPISVEYLKYHRENIFIEREK